MQVYLSPLFAWEVKGDREEGRERGRARRCRGGQRTGCEKGYRIYRVVKDPIVGIWMFMM